MDDFLLRAFLGGLGVAAVAGPLGCFVVWRRMAYFGDTLAHSALLGVALGYLLQFDLTLGVAAVCAVLAVLLALGEGRATLSGDTMLGILSHSALALGLVLIGLLDRVQVDLLSYLFGDILAIGRADLYLIFGGGLAALAALAALWRPLLAVAVDEDMARVDGVPVRAVRIGFMLLMALVVAIALKVVGALLITALLIIPAAAARRFARTPEQMAAIAAALGAVAVAAGLGGSLVFDTPSGPTVVVAAALLFLAATLVAGLANRRAPA